MPLSKGTKWWVPLPLSDSPWFSRSPGRQGVYCIRDNESTNGTLLNGEYVEAPVGETHERSTRQRNLTGVQVPIKPGDVIVFGGDTPEMVEGFSYLVEEYNSATPVPGYLQRNPRRQSASPGYNYRMNQEPTQMNILDKELLSRGSEPSIHRSPPQNRRVQSLDMKSVQELSAKRKGSHRMSRSHLNKSAPEEPRAQTSYDLDAIRKSHYLVCLFLSHLQEFG